MTRLLELAASHYSKLLQEVHSIGMEAISEPNWRILKSTAELVLNPEFAVFQVHQYIKKLKQQLPDKSTEFNAQPYLKIIHWARLIQPNYRKRQAKYIECFNDPLWWQHCVEKIKTLPLENQAHATQIVHEAQIHWHSQQAYAHYSTLDMIHVYQTVIPVFAEWLHYAKTEFKKQGHTLTPRLKTFYQDYLAWFERALLEEKLLLRKSLYERLAIGLKKGYGAWDDVIEAMRDDLKQMGILTTAPKESPRVYGYLTPEAWVNITQIIEQEGSVEEKMALHQLAYYQTSFDNHSHFVQHEQQPIRDSKYPSYWRSRNDTMSLKSTLYPYLPRFFQWLFWGEEARIQFFQHAHYQFLLAQETAFSNREIDLPNTTIETLLSHPTWQQSQMCLQLILSEDQRITQWLTYPLAFFFPEIVDQLKNYQQSLKQSADSWVNKQLALLKHVMADKEMATLTKEDKSTLESAFVYLETLQKQWLFSPNIKNQFTELEQRYRVLCQGELPAQPAASVQHTSTTNTKPLYEVFKETLLDTIVSFESTQNRPDIAVEALKNQIEAACSYDKTLLHLCVQDYLNHAKKAADFPPQLKRTLQEILDRPQFKPTLLNQSITDEALAVNQAASVKPITLPAAQTVPSERGITYDALDEDPWNYPVDQLERHCNTIKSYTEHSNSDVSYWDQKLYPYLLLFLKHLHALENFDDFALHRDKAALVMTALFQAGHNKTLPPLHQAIKEIAEMIPTLTHKTNWYLFKKIHVEVQIGALERFRNFKNTPTDLEAASYASQKELGFLRPPRSIIKNDISFSSPPQLLPNPTL